MGRTIFQHILEQNGIPKLREKIADIDRHRREKRGKRTKKRGKTNLMHYRDRNTSVHPAPHKLLEKIEKERAVSLFLSCRLPLLFDYPDCSYQKSRCKNANLEQVSMSLYFSGVKFRRLFQGIQPPVCTIASLWSSG